MSIVPGTSLERPGRRVVQTLQAGRLDGTPVLVFHPTPSSRLFVRQHADAALRTDTRLLGFSRPGYGGSTPATPGLRLVAEDAIAVADSFGVNTFAVLGFSGGTPYAAATAALHPDRVMAVGLCSAVGELAFEQDDEAEEKELRDLLGLDDDALAAALVADASPADAPYLDRALAASQALSLRDALEDEDGQVTFAGPGFDRAAYTPPWDVDVRALSTPTWVWQGTADEVTPPEHARWWAETLPHATVVLRDGLGHLGTFEAHRDEMLATLRDAD